MTLLIVSAFVLAHLCRTFSALRPTSYRSRKALKIEPVQRRGAVIRQDRLILIRAISALNPFSILSISS